MECEDLESAEFEAGPVYTLFISLHICMLGKIKTILGILPKISLSLWGKYLNLKQFLQFLTLECNVSTPALWAKLITLCKPASH